jgi:hypothetical protein
MSRLYSCAIFLASLSMAGVRSIPVRFWNPFLYSAKVVLPVAHPISSIASSRFKYFSNAYFSDCHRPIFLVASA